MEIEYTRALGREEAFLTELGNWQSRLEDHNLLWPYVECALPLVFYSDVPRLPSEIVQVSVRASAW